MPKLDCFVSVIAPLKNDEEIVARFVDAITSVLEDNYSHHELLLVDDGSTDDTALRVNEVLDSYQHVRLIRLTRSFGNEIAISAGLDTVIGDFVVVLLPRTDPPELVPALVESCRGGVDIVYGVRRTRSGEPLWSRLGAAAFYTLTNRVLRLGVKRDATHLRVMSRRAVNTLVQMRDRARFLRTLSAYAGFATESVAYDPVVSHAHGHRRPFWDSVRLALNVIVANSSQPLRFMSLFGVAAAALNALYMAYIVVIFLFKEDRVQGWVTQSMQSAVMNLFMFLILALMAEYIGRVLEEVRGRPLYFVAEERQSSVAVPSGERNVVSASEHD